MKLSIIPHLVPIFENPKTINLLVGNRGGGKTQNVALYILYSLTIGRGNWVVARRYKEDVKKSCLAILISTAKELGIWNNFEEKKSELKLIYKPTGNFVLGEGLDDPEALKASNNIRFLWLDEADQITYQSFSKNSASLRTLNQDPIEIWLTTNYKNSSHWIKKQIWDKRENDTNIQTVNVKWEDNPFLPPDWEEFLNKTYRGNPVAYERDVIGKWLEIEASRVMPELKIEEKELSLMKGENILAIHFVSGRCYALLAKVNSFNNGSIYFSKEWLLNASQEEINKIIFRLRSQKIHFQIKTSSQSWSNKFQSQGYMSTYIPLPKEEELGNIFRVYQMSSSSVCEILLRQSEEVLYEVNDDTGGLFNTIANKEEGNYYAIYGAGLIV